jgi:hypothetical protein
MRDVCSVHPMLLDLIIIVLVIFGELHKLWISSFCSFLFCYFLRRRWQYSHQQASVKQPESMFFCTGLETMFHILTKNQIKL